MIDKELFKLLGKDKKYIFIVVFLMVLGLIFNILITASICGIIYIAYENLEPINYLYVFIVLGVAIICRFALSYAISQTKDFIARKVKFDLRAKMYRKILCLGTKGQGDINVSGLSQLGVEGIEQLDLYYSTYLPQFFYSMIAPFVLFIITSFISYQVSLVLLCCVPLIPLSIILVSKYAKKIFAKYRGKYIKMGDSFLDCIMGLRELKIYGADRLYQEKMNIKSEEFRKVTMKVLIMQLASITIMDLVAYGGAGIGISLTIYYTVNSNLYPIFAVFLILIAAEFFLPLRSLGSAFHVAMNGLSAGKKISNLLKSEETKRGKKEVTNTDIKFVNASFKYPDALKNTLKNISINFEESKFSAIVGPSGSGKSTLINLLIGQYSLNEGSILIGEDRLENYSRTSYFSKICYVSSNTYLFNDTIFNNFKMAKEDIKEEEIKEELKKVKLEKLLLNGGVNTLINEDSTNISGGERQRLALAINLVSPKEIYIFDEATSNIDVESEEIIMDRIIELAKSHTVILVSHRLANVVKADKIYYLESGQIVEEGTHDELIKLDKNYANLFNNQKELENMHLNLIKEVQNG